jgi:hypothetical protein
LGSSVCGALPDAVLVHEALAEHEASALDAPDGVDPPSLDAVAGLAHRPGLHEGRVGAVVGLGQAEAGLDATGQQVRPVFVVLGVGGEGLEHQDERVVADDRMLVLQVVVQAEPLGRQMLPDHRHGEVRAALAAHLRGPGVAIVAGLVRQGLGICLRESTANW